MTSEGRHGGPSSSTSTDVEVAQPTLLEVLDLRATGVDDRGQDVGRHHPEQREAPRDVHPDDASRARTAHRSYVAPSAARVVGPA